MTSDSDRRIKSSNSGWGLWAGAVNSNEDTIFAFASGGGHAAIGVVRISGSAARRVADLFGMKLPAHRVASVRRLHRNGRIIDEAMVLFFEGPNSYTGEDLVELHCHGGPAVRDAVVKILADAPGFRLADPGEFTRRSVLNGRMDLTRAEAVNDLIQAQTEAQRVQALEQLEGRLEDRFDGWTTDILRCLAHIEAYIDFPDEDIPDGVLADIERVLLSCHQSMQDYLDDDRRGEILRDGLRIAVVGPPNVGKSSFVNWLSRRDAAIVSDEAGTTRDIIEVHLDLGGYPVIVADTAGLRDGGGVIEAEGMRRARRWAEQADLRVLILDPDTLKTFDMSNAGLLADDLILLNKIDLSPDKDSLDASMAMSVRREEGLDAVVNRLTTMARDRMDISAGPPLTRARHREALSLGVEWLGSAASGLAANREPELIAEDLRLASDALGRVTGRVDVEALLDIVFRDFCIGK